MKNDKFFLKRCLELAIQGIGKVSPNPMVGAVIVHNKHIIGEGYHEEYGSNHAEVNAINNVKDKSLLNKSKLYVNLEPCSHFGKTPPCCDLIIKHQIPEVIIGCIDSHPEVAGKGIKKMQAAGIKVNIKMLEKESKSLNKRFFTFHKKKRPYIILKWAESKDKFIAPKNQKGPFWMTSIDSKRKVHKWRAEEDAVLIGRITAQKDNPRLNVREFTGINPVRIIIDQELKLPKDLNIFNMHSKTLIFNTIKEDSKDSIKLIKINKNKILEEIMTKLYKENIQSLIIEGGTYTIQSFIEEGYWDEARIFHTEKKLLNGINAPIINGHLVSKREIGPDKLIILENR